MIVTILTLFPDIFLDIFSSSIVGRAQKRNLVKIELVNIRDFAFDKHRSVDDKPYSGGVGMLMRVDVVDRAISKVKCKNKKCKEKIILLDPKGELFSQNKAYQYAKMDHLILVCGHYEGIDARINHFVEENVSIGRYILTGGEIPAMVITDSITRLLPHVLAKTEAVKNESFSKKYATEPPQYTRPKKYKGYEVPSVLLSGNPKLITMWQRSQTKFKKISTEKDSSFR